MIDVKSDPMGVVMADDQMFGNTYSVDLTMPDGSVKRFVGRRPRNFNGVHALIRVDDGKYALMCEDDGHFWNHAILSAERVRQLSAELKEIRKGFVIKPDYKCSYTRYFSPKREHYIFPSEIKKRKGTTPLVEIVVEGIEDFEERGKKLVFDASWTDSLISVLDKVGDKEA